MSQTEESKALRLGIDYRHVESGNTYTIMSISKDVHSKEELVTYYDGKGTNWTRARDDFEKKFVEVNPKDGNSNSTK